MFTQVAMDVLTFNKMTPESFLSSAAKTPYLILKDKDNVAWTFTARRRCFLYILARYAPMSHYQEIYKDTR